MSRRALTPAGLDLAEGRHPRRGAKNGEPARGSYRSRACPPPYARA